MKKIFCILMMIITSINVKASELMAITVPIKTDFSDITMLYEDYYKFSYLDKEYYFNRADTVRLREYNKREFDFFIKERGMTTYKKLNENVYAAVYYCAPYSKVFAGGDSWKGYRDFKLDFYDSNFNLINSIQSNYYISTFGFKDNKYYYSTSGGDKKTYVSRDMKSWEFGEISEQNVEIRSESIYLGTNIYHQVSLDDGKTFYEVNYEGFLDFGSPRNTVLPFALKSGWERPYIYYYISSDNIKFIKLNFNNVEELKYFSNNSPIKRWYVTDNYFVIETETQRITVPMSEINAELDKLKSVPYINLNGKLLAFEVPPTIQDDRTLVPMRFLFEQMDAEVEWDNETQTATVYKNDDTIAFSIDDTEAEVNNTVNTMEVPARLINGKTMIPLRFLSEELGYTVEWNEELRMVTITE